MRIVVVGTCASGKSTLVEALRARGYDAVVVAQEHSEVAGLWRRSNPDVLVVLDVNLATIRARRGLSWPKTVYHAQVSRLSDARDNADIVVDTGTLGVAETVTAVEEVIRQLGEKPAGV